MTDQRTPADELTAAANALEPLARKAQQDVATNDYWSSYDKATAWRDGLTNGMGGASGDLAAALPPEAVLELSRWLRSAARDAREIGSDPHALAVARALTPCDHRFPDPFPDSLDHIGNCRRCDVSYQEAKAQRLAAEGQPEIEHRDDCSACRRTGADRD
ncbi:hypothetical protein [Streptomyces chartreusis]|uniref:hypothetical protein n=1 Tax=Streptomyces chartreusis TaxID=1969 RepID=UPI00364D99A1